jgi:archaetidylinositol phosphate synthase
MPKKIKLDKKKGQSYLHYIERKWIDFVVPKLPSFVTSHHLTLSTILWSGLILLFSYFAHHYDINWLWGVSLMIFFHYITDSLDGSLGKYRNAGLIKWGFFMDHILDFVFLSSIMIGYAFIFPQYVYLHFFTLIIFTLFMVNSFLSLAAKGEFEITFMGFGPTEMRIMFIAVNTVIIIFGKTFIGPFAPYVLAGSFIVLLIFVYKTQKELWEMDMLAKKKVKKKKNRD